MFECDTIKSLFSTDNLQEKLPFNNLKPIVLLDLPFITLLNTYIHTYLENLFKLVFEKNKYQICKKYKCFELVAQLYDFKITPDYRP